MMTATKLNARNWNTYRIAGYTYQAGDDARATGGVHLMQVRQTRTGNWQTRVVDSNGRFQSAGKTTPVTAAEGEAHLATAEAR